MLTVYTLSDWSSPKLFNFFSLLTNFQQVYHEIFLVRNFYSTFFAKVIVLSKEI